jgi:hypothetical protein
MELKKLAKRVYDLPEELVDLLWYNCGWIDANKGNRKALPEERLINICSSLPFAEKQLENLLQETPYDIFMRNLRKTEKLLQ